MVHNDVVKTNGSRREAGTADRTVDPDVSLAVNTTLELLTDPMRRELLGYLAGGDTRTSTVDELVEHLSGWNVGHSGEPSSDARTMLHHVHLLKLTATGVVEYDERCGEVQYRGNARLERWLLRIRAEEAISP